MPTDYGVVNDGGQLNIGSLSTALIFIDQHVQGPVTSSINSGVPGGLSGPASGTNQMSPGAFQGPPPASTYGLSNTTTFAAIYNAGGTSAYGPANPVGAGNLLLFSYKNPA